MRGRGRFSIVGAAALLGCAADPIENNTSGPSLTTIGDTTSGEDGGDTLPTTGAALDLGGTGGLPETRCKKVDFLFVIDSSGSMQNHQENLIAAFPGFMDAIEATLADAMNFHVMVVDTDENAAEICDWWCDVGSPFCPYECYSSLDEDIWQDCDRAFGAGVRYPLGLNSSNVDCGFPGGRRYLTSADDGLRDKFECAARVGSSHTDEWQMNAMTAAMSGELNAVNGCNAGFLRDDAILVVTLITDEPDTESNGTLAEWHDAVVAAKGGNEDAVVMLGLVSDRDLPDAVCQNTEGFPLPSPNINEFVDSFSRTRKASICLEDYSPFFAESVALIDLTCDEFMPEG